MSLRAAHWSLRAGRHATMAESKSKKQLEVDQVEDLFASGYESMTESKDAKLLGALAFIKNTLVGDLLNELGRSSTKKSLSSGQQLPGIVKAEMIEECLIVAGSLQQLATKLVMHKNRVDYDVKLTLERLIKLKIEPSSASKKRASVDDRLKSPTSQKKKKPTSNREYLITKKESLIADKNKDIDKAKAELADTAVQISEAKQGYRDTIAKGQPDPDDEDFIKEKAKYDKVLKDWMIALKSANKKKDQLNQGITRMKTQLTTLENELNQLKSNDGEEEEGAAAEEEEDKNDEEEEEEA